MVFIETAQLNIILHSIRQRIQNTVVEYDIHALQLRVEIAVDSRPGQDCVPVRKSLLPRSAMKETTTRTGRMTHPMDGTAAFR